MTVRGDGPCAWNCQKAFFFFFPARRLKNKDVMPRGKVWTVLLILYAMHALQALYTSVNARQFGTL